MLFRPAGTQAERSLSPFPTAKFENSLWAESRKPCGGSQKTLLSINRLQFLPRLEPHRLAWRNRHLGSGARVASDARLSRAHVKHAKPPQLNAIAARQRILHALKDGFHRQFGLGLGDAGSGYHFVDNVELDHEW